MGVEVEQVGDLWKVEEKEGDEASLQTGDQPGKPA